MLKTFKVKFSEAIRFPVAKLAQCLSPFHLSGILKSFDATQLLFEADVEERPLLHQIYQDVAEGD